MAIISKKTNRKRIVVSIPKPRLKMAPQVQLVPEDTKAVIQTVQIKEQTKPSANIFTDSLKAIQIALDDPTVLLTICLVAAAVFIHLGDPQAGPFRFLITKLKGSTITAQLGKWMGDNLDKMIGIAIMVPAIMGMKVHNRNVGAVLAIGLTIFAPKLPVSQYGVLAVTVLLLFRLNNNTERLVLLIIAMGIFMIAPDDAVIVPSERSARPKPVSS